MNNVKYVSELRTKLLKLGRLQKELRELEREINTEYIATPITFYGQFIFDKDGYDFKFMNVNVEENSIEVDYKVTEDVDFIACNEYVNISYFIHHAGERN